MQNDLDSGRRKAIFSLLGLAAGGLHGCCSFPKDKIKTDVPIITPSQAFLRPSRVGGNKTTRFALDAHAHFFNASDVNAGGYIKGPVAHSIENDYLRHFVERLAPVVDRLAYLAPTANDEFEYLTKFAMRSSTLELTSDQTLQSESDMHRDRVAKELTKALQAEGLDQEYRLLRGREISLLRRADQVEPALDEKAVRRAIDPVLRSQSDGAMAALVGPNVLLETVDGGLEFVAHMLSPRWMNLRDYQYAYTVSPDAYGIDGVFGALVDFDYWLKDSRPRSGRGDQIRLHALLSRLSGGYMLPLVAYNPWSDLRRSDESFHYVVEAVEKYGFIGVKIYPPMGFYAYGNDTLPVLSASPSDLPNRRDLDKVLGRLFRWAGQANIPVMAHTNESMGRDDGSDDYGGPDGWKELLNAAREGNWPSPTINAGHFGGAIPSKKHSKQNWPQQFGELMRLPKGDKLYGDLGYWSALRQCHKGPTPSDCDVAKARLRAAVAANSRAVDRIMYGTDWLMLSKETMWQNYAQEVASNLKGTLPLEKVMYQNALNCFSLGPGQEHRARISKTLNFPEKDLPAWLTYTN